MECIKVTSRKKNDYALDLEIKLTSKELAIIYAVLGLTSTDDIKEAVKKANLQDLKILNNEDYDLYSTIRKILKNCCNFDI